MTERSMLNTDISHSLAPLSQTNNGRPARLLSLLRESMRSTTGLQAVIHSIMIDKKLRTGGISFSLVPASASTYDSEVDAAKVSASTRFDERLSNLSARPRLEERRSTTWTGIPPPEDISDIICRIEALYGDDEVGDHEDGPSATMRDSLLADIQSREEKHQIKLDRQDVQESFDKVFRGIFDACTGEEALEGFSTDFDKGRVYALPMLCDTEDCCVSSGTRL